MNDLLFQAFQLHRAGRIREAINLYKKSLAEESGDAQLLYLLGTAYLQTGQIKEGVETLQASLSKNLNNPDALCNLGNGLNDLGRPEEALDSYKSALILKPGFAQCYNNQGNVLKSLNRPGEAVTSYDKALAITPDLAEIHNNKGDALYDLGRPDEALISYANALAIDPRYSEAYKNKGDALTSLKRWDEAVASYYQALAIRPDVAAAYNNMGKALSELKRFDEALTSYDKAIALWPEYAAAHSNRGNVLRSLNRLEEALASCDKALTLIPTYIRALNNRGNVLLSLNRLDEALKSYNDAIAIKSDDAEVCWNKSLLLILSGDYLNGWELYEWRLKYNELNNKHGSLSKFAWRGNFDLSGKKLLVYAEQGLGDTIQFCRYLPKISAMGINLVVEIPESLINLISTLETKMEVVAEGDALPEFDACCPMMSLPYVFKTSIETIPSKIRYLSSDPEKVRLWKHELGQKNSLKVGLAWSGATGHKNDSNRSMKLEQLSSIIELSKIEWHSLQKEHRPADYEFLAKNPAIHRHCQNDFSETAALIECMDLIISVDTSVAHAAGALGKPVWILLQFSADYRWLLNRTDSPWYPTVKLYRQPRPGDWESVVAEIRRDLLAFAS